MYQEDAENSTSLNHTRNSIQAFDNTTIEAGTRQVDRMMGDKKRWEEVITYGPTEGACSMAVPAMSTRPRTNALRMPSTHPANHG